MLKDGKLFEKLILGVQIIEVSKYSVLYCYLIYSYLGKLIQQSFCLFFFCLFFFRDGSFEYPQHMFWLRNKNFSVTQSNLVACPKAALCCDFARIAESTQ